MKIHFNKPYMKVTFQLTIRETMEIIIHTHIHIYVSTYICRVGVTIRVRVKGVNESLLTLDVITMQ